MSSNILAGERRWASARRTGMTVLGKVAVPKPLNLPSQRLENHGLDPSVEIVPKGTLGWGSRPSSSASNPWGSSSVSSTAEGYGSSPGHPSGRPSSSGSRPSTAGSEITHDHSSNAWGPSSRPSSASGISASNQTSLTSLRPHSAETRPASSQMSRFAEQHADSAVAHHPERAGLASSSDKERFSLSSGDFPTLNSIADGSVKSSDSRDQGSCSRPSSASGVVAKKDNLDKPQADVESGTVNAWKREGYRNNDEMHPSTDKWHGEPPRYHNANVPSPQFDGWRGPSMNHPGVWYQGLPPGPPYGAPVAPGGFPVEQFPFYCPPRMPPSGLANSQPVPLTGPGPGPMGHPKNGELFRPPMPDAFVRPGMPFRPGFYPGPMPFEGYYGPPMGYCNPNEREVPFKGMPAGPPVYNRYPARDSDPVAFNDSTTSHNRTDKNGPGIKRLSEKAEHNHLDDVPRQVLLKKNHGDVNHAGWGENMATQNFPNPKKRSQPGMAMRTKEWGADYNSDDDMYPRSATHVLHSSSGPKDDCSGSVTFINRPQCYGSGDNVALDNIRLKKLETTASSSPVLPPEPLAGDGGLSSSAMGPTLIQKIEGLNEKVRTSDSRNEGSHSSHWAEQKGAGAIIGEIIVPFGDDTSNVTAASRRGYGVVRGKTDNNNKQKFNSPGDADGWQKKLPASVQSSDNSSASNFHKNRTTTAVVAAVDVLEKQEMDSEVVDSTDSQAQRLKMRESVKQRALQLQKEEEERTREQKAKALAKLEELNRRTPVGNTMIQKDENVLLSGISQQDEGSQALYESSRTVAKSLSLSPSLAVTPGVRILVSESTGEWDEKPADSHNSLPCETLKTTDTAVLPSQPLPLKELLTDGDRDCVVAPQLDEAVASTNKQSGYKQKQNVPTEIHGSRKTIVTKARHNNIEHEGTESVIVAPGNVGSGSDSKTTEIHVAVESSSQQKRRSNRNIKNKHKPDDFPAPPTSSTTPDENNPADMSTNSEMSKATHLGVDKGSIQAQNGGGAGGYSKQQSSSFSEGAQVSTNLHKKPQQSRRFARNQPAARFSDKYHGNDNVVWAPVQTPNKTEPATETGLKTVEESAISAKNDDQVQNNVKSKRAEMERYVPKPVAKELAQQGSVQQSGSSSSVGISPSDVAEKVEPEFKSSVKQSGFVAGNVVPAGESRIEDLRHSKQTKSLGGWRQRGSAEQQRSKGAHNGSSSIASNPRNHQSMEPELSNTKTEQIGLRDPSASDVANTWKDSGAGISSQGRYQENAGRGKRHGFKGERSMGSDREHEKNSGSQKMDKSHTQLQDPRVNPTGRSSSSKENRDFEDRGSSHWQPKSSSPLHSGDSSSTAQNVGGGAVKKGIQSLPEEHVAYNDKQSRELDSRVDPSFPKSNFLPEGAVSHQGQRREKKLPSSKGHSRAPTDAAVIADDPTLAGSDESQTKQHFSSDYRRGRYQNVRSVASREPRGDLNNERHGQNLQYEYQPVGEKKLENTEDGSHGVGPRYKEKGHSHNHSRRGRGQFHGRQSSNVQVGAGYG